MKSTNLQNPIRGDKLDPKTGLLMTAPKQAHTPEPWRVKEDGWTIDAEFAAHVDGIAAILFNGLQDPDCRAQAGEDARRIVACVNACEHIGTGLLEEGGGVLAMLRRRAELQTERDALKALNAEMVKALRALVAWDDGVTGYSRPFDDARAVLAKVKPS